MEEYIPYFWNYVKGKFMAKCNMELQEKYFNLIKEGKKSIELRLFDEKRQRIKVGDVIVFTNNQNKNETIYCRVSSLFRAESFEKLCTKFDCIKAGFMTNADLIATMQTFYSLDMQRQYGVVGIELNLCEVTDDN